MSLFHPTQAPAIADARSPEQGRSARASLTTRASLAAVAAALVLATLVLPLWQAQLVAPQYPDNLHLIAYGSHVTGDVEEIDLLNHYVGMRAFDPADVPEMALWPLVVGAGVLAAIVAVLAPRRLLRRLALAYLWLTPLGILAVIQLRLHQYGHDIDPAAALRIPDFTPWVLGPTRVMNFTTWSYPGLGLLALVAAGAVATFGPRAVGRLRAGPRSVTGALAVLLVLAAPSPAHAAHDHDDHSTHGSEEPALAPADGISQGPSVGPAGAPPPRPAPFDGQARDLAALLASVQPGDRVSLAPGRWRGPATVDVPIELHGLGRAVIEGDGSGSVLVIRAPGTTVTGVHVRGSGPGPHGDPAGIRIEADDVRVESVVVEDSYVGVAVVGAERIHLIGNAVHGRAGAAITGEDHAVVHDDHEQVVDGGGERPRGDGISLWHAHGVLVRDNHIHGVRDGVYVSFGSAALVDRNHVADSRYAVHSMFATGLTLAENHFERNLSGAVLMYGGPALLLRNAFTDHRSTATGFGMLLKDIEGVEAVENVVTRNRVGLHLDLGASAATPALVRRNTVSGNDVAVALNPSTRARLSANSFVSNHVQVAPKGGGAIQAEWTDGGWGNYWDTYRGYEAAIPGLGAVPHAEGGRVDVLLQRAPILAAIADSPGVRVLRELEARWTTRTPAIVDDLPLTRPVSPAVPAHQADPAATLLVGVASLMLLVGGAAAFARLRSNAPPQKDHA